MPTTYPAQTVTAGSASSAVSGVSWGSIFAGAAVAIALMILFTTLGVGIGAAVLDPRYDQNPGSGLATGSGIYLIVTQLIALGAGGYIAARLAGVPRPITSVLHGAAVWAIATIFVAWAAITGAGVLFGAASTFVWSSASAVGSAAEAVVPDNLSLPNFSKIAGSVSLDALPDALQATLREKGVTEDNLRQEATEALRNVFSQREQDAAMAEMRQTLGDMLRSPSDIGADLSAFLDRLVGGENAIISEEDRRQAMAVLERRLDITPQEAQGILQAVDDGVQDSIEQAKATVQRARTQSIEAAQTATDAIATTALLLALASLLSLVAACGGAFGGKPESMIGDRIADHQPSV